MDDTASMSHYSYERWEWKLDSAILAFKKTSDSVFLILNWVYVWIQVYLFHVGIDISFVDWGG